MAYARSRRVYRRPVVARRRTYYRRMYVPRATRARVGVRRSYRRAIRR